MRKSTVWSFGAMFFLSVCALLFLENLVLPHLEGRNDYYVYSGDNAIYRAHVDDNHDVRDLINVGQGQGIAIGSGNLFGMAAYALLVQWISKEHFHHVLLFLNLLLLACSIRNYRIIFDLFEAKQYPLFLLWFSLNPLLICSLTALSKEVWGVYIVSALLRYRISGSYLRLLFIIILSFAIRDAFAAAGIVFVLMSTFKLNKMAYLCGISLLFPLLPSGGMTEFLLEGQDDASMGISVFLNNLQSYPFGYVVAYVPKLLLSAFANLHPFRLVLPVENVIGNLTTVSSFLSFVLTVMICRKVFLQKQKLRPLISSLFFSYTFIVVLTAFIHHRYLFPLYPVLPLMILLTTSRKPLEVPAGGTSLARPGTNACSTRGGVSLIISNANRCNLMPHYYSQSRWRNAQS